MKKLLFTCLLFGMGSSQASPLPPEQAQTMERFQDAKFGLFIHWGIYSMYEGHYQGAVTPRYAEWIANNGRIPIADYRKMGSRFNPVKYDPAAWAKLAKDNGMKYLVITTKHHDGYALFDTKVSDWSVMNSTYGKDLIGPLAKACRSEGLLFGTYYSQSLDWVNGGQPRTHHWDKESLPSYGFDDYLKNISLPQVKELLTSYPEIDIMWWDMPKDMTPARTAPFNALLATYPHVIQNPRLGKGGDKNFATFEQRIPPQPQTDPYWESCMTMNHTWGYRRGDNDWKSTGTLIRNLIGVVSKGGNYLLNIGPKPDGTIPQESIERIQEIGSWLKENGVAIYGTTHTPFVSQQPWKGSCTKKTDATGTTLYLHVFDWPSTGTLPVLGLDSPVTEAYLLKSGEKLTVSTLANGIELSIPLAAPSLHSSTVVLRVPGALKTSKVSGLLGADGTRFAAMDALQERGAVTFQSLRNMAINWEADQSMTWKFDVVEPGRYWVKTITCAPHESELTIECGDQKIAAILPNTGDWAPFDKQFDEVVVGTLDLKNTGAHTLHLTPTNREDWKGLSLHAVTLVPERPMTQDEEGSISLPIYAAAFQGNGLIQAWNGVRNWTQPDESLSWEVMITRQGDTFAVVAEYACAEEVELSFLVNGEPTVITVPATEGQWRFLRRELGSLPVTASGRNSIELRASGPLCMANLKLWNRQALANETDAVDTFPVVRANHFLKSRGVAADTYHPKKLVDNDVKTSLAPNFKKQKADPLTLEYDLGEVRMLKGLRGVSEEDALDWIKVSVLVDGEWVEVLSAPGQPGAFELMCKPIKARIVQVKISNANPYFKLFEMEPITLP